MRGLAYAKINLALEVTGKRPDGYHELVSTMQTISLADELSLEPDEAVSLECDVPELAGDDNLVLRAARLLRLGGRFTLRKRVPVAAGLGGGSSDAALALRLLDAVYGLRLPSERLLELAGELGSDVPFFLHGGTAHVEGRGERVTPLADLPARWLVLLNPGVPLSTARVFAELRPDEYAVPSSLHGSRLVNTLQVPAMRLQPAIAGCLERLRGAGAGEVLLSGSGATVFGLVEGKAAADEIARHTGGIAARFVGRQEAVQSSSA